MHSKIRILQILIEQRNYAETQGWGNTGMGKVQIMGNLRGLAQAGSELTRCFDGSKILKLKTKNCRISYPPENGADLGNYFCVKNLISA